MQLTNLINCCLSADLLYNEREVLSLIEQGDEVAFTKLFHHHRNRIFTIALKLSGSSALAEEAVQDVFLKIWLKRTGLGHVQNFEAYLFTIVQNTMYKTLKRIAKKHKQALAIQKESSVEATALEDQVVEREYQSILQKGIEKLPNQQRQVYTLIRERGLKRKEVADLLELQPDTVKYHLSQAIKNLWSYCRLHLPFLIQVGLVLFFSLLLAL